MKNEKLERAINLAKEITELEQFIFTIDATQSVSGSGKKSILSIITIKNTKTISIYCSRFFGCDSHIASIFVPDTIIPDICLLAKERLKNLKEHLAALWA